MYGKQPDIHGNLRSGISNLAALHDLLTDMDISGARIERLKALMPFLVSSSLPHDVHLLEALDRMLDNKDQPFGGGREVDEAAAEQNGGFRSMHTGAQPQFNAVGDLMLTGGVPQTYQGGGMAGPASSAMRQTALGITSAIGRSIALPS